ncbi:MAG: hypothetical protein ABI609_01800 [Acidobacteriota bacterium]
MQTIEISKFKATCLAVLEQVRKTGEPIRVTRFGQAVAEVVPSSASKVENRRLGALEGTIEIVEDLVAPVIDLEDLDAWQRR